MLPAIVFDYLLTCGAEFVGTVKRLAYCWPFTYNQQLKDDDKRTLVDPKGHSTLFLKWCKVGNSKPIFAAAFRNGSQRVATALSSLHKSHEWEGVILKPSEKVDYERDPKCLESRFFKRVDLGELLDPETSENEDEDEGDMAMSHLLNDVIVPYTLRQGE